MKKKKLPVRCPRVTSSGLAGCCRTGLVDMRGSDSKLQLPSPSPSTKLTAETASVPMLGCGTRESGSAGRPSRGSAASSVERWSGVLIEWGSLSGCRQEPLDGVHRAGREGELRGSSVPAAGKMWFCGGALLALAGLGVQPVPSTSAAACIPTPTWRCRFETRA